MRLARVTLIWAALAAAVCCADCRCSGEPAACMARSALHSSRICRGHRAGSHARAALADERILTGTVVGSSRTARTSLDRRGAGRGGGDPRWRPLDHQSARRYRRPPLHIADPVLCLGRDRHVGNLCRRAFGRTAPSIATETANLARRSYVPRGGDRRRDCGPWHTDRGDDGDGVEGGPLRTGPCGDHKSYG